MSKKHSKNRKKGKNALKNNGQLPVKIVNPDYPSISACMIVRNEEEFLENCLKSIRDYVDEIIIVDTGSEDGTVDIARRFTDKVYFHPWEDSFSRAKNQALHYATGDWIFQIDADEELMAGSGEIMRKAVREAEDSDTIYVNILCSYAKGTKKSLNIFQRIFRNNGIIHYEGNIHEQVVGGTKAYYSSIKLWHYGYDVDEEKSLKKFERTTGLLKKEIEKDSSNPIFHHYLSTSYFSRGMFNESADEAVTALELSASKNDYRGVFAWSHYIAAMSFYYLGRMKNAEEYAFKSLNKYPEHVDSYYILTIVALDEGRWDDVIKYGTTFLEKLEHININGKGNNLLTNTMNETPTVNIFIGHAFYAKNSFDEMKVHYKKAYDTSDEKWRAWVDIGIYHMDKSGDFNLAGHFLDLAVKEAPDEHDSWYMLAKYNNKCGLKDKEIEALEKVVEIGTSEGFILTRLFTIYLEREQYDNALNLVNSANNLNPSLYSDLIKLGNCFVEKSRLESAMQCFMKAAEARPDSPEAWNVLGEITLTVGRLDDSQIFLERALQIDNHDTTTILSLCELELRRGNIESHIKYCDMLLDQLCLPRDRTIDSFEDLKSIFLEIGSALDNNQNHSIRIKNIIAQLPSLAQERPLSLS